MSNPLSSATGNLGGGVASLSYKGGQLQVHAMTDAMRLSLGRWAKKHMIEELRTLKYILTPVEYDARFNSLIRDFAAGQYDFGYPGYQAMIATRAGGLTMLSVILQREDLSDDQLLEIDEEVGEEIKRLWLGLEGIDPNEITEEPDPNP